MTARATDSIPAAFLPHLQWLRAQQDEMERLLVAWANINTHTFNLAGLESQRRELERAFEPLGAAMRRLPVPDLVVIDDDGKSRPRPLGDALHLCCRPDAPRRALLSIHFDTVYGVEHPFQSVQPIGDGRLRGPGTSDAKGGLLVLLFALKALERFVAATGHNRLGWHVLLNADEEIGSPGSAHLFEQLAPSADFGMVYEPSLPDGQLIAPRKGSGNFDIVVHGVAAHAGRDFAHGRNAVVTAARIADRLDSLNGHWPDTTINVSRIDGGGPVNMVPATAVIRFNVRYPASVSADEIRSALMQIAADSDRQPGFDVALHGDFTAPPKPIDGDFETMLHAFRACGSQLGLSIGWRPSGGVCDGNRLAAFGIPNVDTLGVRGDRIHSAEEFVILESLAERAQLSALYLMQRATEES